MIMAQNDQSSPNFHRYVKLCTCIRKHQVGLWQLPNMSSAVKHFCSYCMRFNRSVLQEICAGEEKMEDVWTLGGSKHNKLSVSDHKPQFKESSHLPIESPMPPSTALSPVHTSCECDFECWRQRACECLTGVEHISRELFVANLWRQNSYRIHGRYEPGLSLSKRTCLLIVLTSRLQQKCFRDDDSFWQSGLNKFFLQFWHTCRCSPVQWCPSKTLINSQSILQRPVWKRQ